MRISLCAVVVVPGVVHEVHAAIERGADDADGFVLARLWLADVEAAEAERGHLLAGAARVRERARRTRCMQGLAKSPQDPQSIRGD